MSIDTNFKSKSCSDDDDDDLTCELMFRSASSAPIASGSLIPPTSQPVKASSRLRDRAGIPAYLEKWGPCLPSNSRRPGSDQLEDRSTEFDDNLLETSGPSISPLQPWTPRSRTQAERARMSFQERTIALEMLQDLAIPPSEWDQASSTDGVRSNDPHHADPFDFFKGANLHSVLEHSKKALNRRKPSARSIEDVRIEDMIKELTDQRMGMIDTMETDHQLLEWVDNWIFNHPNPSLSHQSQDPSMTSSSSRLGKAFENETLAINVDGFIEITADMDPSVLTSQPLCMTPLCSPLLLHLMRTFCRKFRNPHLALYLFELVRSHPKPLVRYLGLTKEVYLEAMSIRWTVLRDLQGIWRDLVEMHNLGIEIDHEIRTLISGITQVVVMDEMQAESLAQADAEKVHGGGGNDDVATINEGPIRATVTEAMIRQRSRFSNSDRRAVSMMDSVLAEFIDDDQKPLGRRSRNDQR